MRTICNSSYYTQEAYDSDLSDVFRKNWIYVGLTDSFKEVNDYLLLNAYGTSVIVQKGTNGFNAFLNVCIHRHSQLLHQEKGNSQLICRYHGWRYDESGKLKVVPSKNSFQSSMKELDCGHLHTVRIEIVGKFIFVNLNQEALSLAEYLGTTKETLERVSEAIGENISTGSIDFAANWKLVVENTLEGYHINSVHPTTFTKLGMSQTSAVTFKESDLHSEMVLESSISDNGIKKMAAQYASNSFKPDGFFHALVFPNLLIGSTYGLTFYIAKITPHGPEKSSFDYTLYYSTQCPNNHSIKTMIGYTASEFTTTVLNEDKEIVEQVQKGVKLISTSPILSDKEVRIIKFHEIYNKIKDTHL